MSKIESHIVVNQPTHQNNNHNITPVSLQNPSQKIYLKKISFLQLPRKPDQMKDQQSQEEHCTIEKEDRKVLFNKFKSWDMAQMIDNTKAVRQTLEIAPAQEKNLQQFNEPSDDQEYQFITPIKPDSNAHSDGKTGLQYSADRNGVYLLDLSERKIRPKQKGLRRLSAKAFKIVQDLGEATYKQVALRLIKQVQQDDSQGGEEKQQRQENNIKRRVYDALNVLIALQILQKKGRHIVYQQGSQIARMQNMFLNQKETKSRIMFQLKKKAQQLRHKKQEAKRIKEKISIIKKLMNRNERIDAPKDSISFPFVCLSLEPSCLSSMKVSEQKNNFGIVTQNSYQFFGDLDFLLKQPNFLA